MALLLGVSWLCTLLLWGICFPSQKGHNLAHGYSFSADQYSSHAAVLGPHTSNQFHSGALLNTNHDSVSPRDEMQATRHQSIVSLEREPVYHDNNEDASSATSLKEEIVPSKSDSGHEPDEFLVAPSVIKYEKESSGNQYPFGLLVKEHTQEKTMEGISFPTITDFQMFIEKMKRSFLTPGSDLSTHFKTARETMETKMASKGQNTEGEPTKERTAHLDASENEIWNEPVNTMFEQSGEGTSFQIPNENLSAPDPDDSTAGVIATSVYDNQELGPALYPWTHVGPTEHISGNYGSSDNGGIAGENPDISMNAPGVQNEHVQSTSYNLPEQMPPGSFFEAYFPFFRPSQDFSSYSDATSNTKPLNSDKNIQQPQYTPRNEDTFTGNQKLSGGFEHGEEELSKMTPDNILSPPKPSSLNSYGKSIYVNAPRGQHYIPSYVPKHKERPASLFQAYQSTAGKDSKKINYTPTIHPPAFSGSVSSSSENLSTHSSGGHVGVQTSSPYDVYNLLVFTVKPPSSLQASSRHGGYFRDPSTGVTRPSILIVRAKDEETSDPTEQNLVSATQEPKEMTNRDILIPIFGALDSTQSGISSPVDDAGFNTRHNLAPASESIPSRLVGNKGMPRNSGIKNRISDKNPFGSFPTPQRRGMSLNGDYVGATRAGVQQTFIQPTKAQKRLVHVNKEPGTVAYQPPQPLSASKVSGSMLSGVFWRNGGNAKRLPPQMDPNKSPPVKTYYVKSRSSYAKGKVYQSKTSYTPYQLDKGKTSGNLLKGSNTNTRTLVDVSVKGFEEQ